MTVHHTPQTSAFANHRWVVRAGLAAVAATLAIGLSQYRAGTDSDVASRPMSVSDAPDLTRSGVLVQDAIDEALAANRVSDFTRAQDLVQGAIDSALAANRVSDFTRAQDLVQKSIDAALATA